MSPSAESLETLLHRLRSDDGRHWAGEALAMARAEEPAADNGQSGGILHRPSGNRRTSPRAMRALAEFLAAGSADLAEARAEARAGARQAFGFVVVLGTVTFLVTLTASVLAALNFADGAWTAAGFSVPSALVTGLFYRLYRAQSRRADAVRDDLQALEKARVSFLMASGMSDGRARDTTVETIIADLSSGPEKGR
ncbi:hypothetical protein ACLQ2S_24830 [Micromonospora sp. DT48]|uniref:hypothetical protein n=1 Tax=Micromonospora sp. DT48 TaxID=3393429 RepID=UPI003CF22278